MPGFNAETAVFLRGMWKKITSFYWRYERHISSLALIGGFVFDALTLKKVDQLIDNLWVVVHLLVVSLCIFLLNVTEREDKGRVRENFQFWLIFIMQFAFGGLLSTFLVFYFRSATLSASWPFLLLLLLAFAGNEIFKKHYSRLIFQISFLFISIFSFAIYVLPILFHEIGSGVFLLSGLVSLVAISFFIFMLWLFARERFGSLKDQYILLAAIVGIYAIVNVLYFTNLIPPLPLSLKAAGVYHSLVRDADGNYDATEEPKSWQNFFIAYDPYYEVPGDPIYAYTAIYSPAKLDTTIIDEWQYYATSTNKWITESRIDLPIDGGRDGGYRTYSSKTSLTPGFWRVNVVTSNGLYIGRIKFEVRDAVTEPSVVTTTLDD
jgi:hypothetical protein